MLLTVNPRGKLGTGYHILLANTVELCDVLRDPLYSNTPGAIYTVNWVQELLTVLTKSSHGWIDYQQTELPSLFFLGNYIKMIEEITCQCV